MLISKKLGKRGGITIPQQLRHAAGLHPGAPIDIEADGSGLIISKHVPSCNLCGAVENVVTVEGMDICPACAKRIAAVAAEKLVDKINDQ